MDIRCKKCDCKHNRGCCCQANKIKIGRGVDCETYVKDEERAKNLKQQAGQSMFEVSASLEKQALNKNTKIICNAKCLFNNNGICYANGVTVLEDDYSKNIPYCATQILD